MDAGDRTEAEELEWMIEVIRSPLQMIPNIPTPALQELNEMTQKYLRIYERRLSDMETVKSEIEANRPLVRLSDKAQHVLTRDLKHNRVLVDEQYKVLNAILLEISRRES